MSVCLAHVVAMLLGVIMFKKARGGVGEGFTPSFLLIELKLDTNLLHS